MYPPYLSFWPQPLFSRSQTQPYLPQPVVSTLSVLQSRNTLSSSDLVHHSILKTDKDPKTFTDSELIEILNNQTNILKRAHGEDHQKQIPIIINMVSILIRVPKPILVLITQNEFFSLLRTLLGELLQQWCHDLVPLSDNKLYLFRNMSRLVRRLIKATDDVTLLPSWMTGSSLLEPISTCLIDLATSTKLFDENNKKQFKYFTRLFNAYVYYQQSLTQHNHSQQDTFLQLIDPLHRCLSSSNFINIFNNLSIHANSLTTTEKFFLLMCPAFLTSYNGSQLEKTMQSLLSTMLPQYVNLLDRLISSINQWGNPMVQVIQHLIEMIYHGTNHFPKNARLVRHHLSLIDDVVKLVNEPRFYKNIRNTLSNRETYLMDTLISFLVNMISEHIILTHMKQSHVAPIFLHLASCDYDPIVFNVYTLFAYTAREEDIKSMDHPDRLLDAILKSLKIVLEETTEKEGHKEQLLETLKILVQHDQIKDEILQKNALPFLLEWTNKLTDKTHILIIEILWSLAFREKGALALRSNQKFLENIQTIFKESASEPLKKATDGLLWKLVREPAFLRMKAQKAEKERAVNGVTETIVEVVNRDGKEQLVTNIQPIVNSTVEHIFEYDIMISYCHADKKLIYKIYQFLQEQGLKLWIDLNNMHGPAMNAMADAVENSEFVLMCMSDAYKQSTYCQAEAEYAFKRKRRLIPLIVRQGYKPDGWLGFMIGSRIYVDFGRFDFEIACEKLMTEIRLQRKRPLRAKSVLISQHEKPTDTILNKQDVIAKPSENHLNIQTNNSLYVYIHRRPISHFIEKPLPQWTDSDVLDFLYSERLIHLMPLCETMDGLSLIQLYKMCITQNNGTYNLLDKELIWKHQTKLPIGVYARFISIMEEQLSELALPSALTTSERLQTAANDFQLKSIRQKSLAQKSITPGNDAQESISRVYDAQKSNSPGNDARKNIVSKFVPPPPVPQSPLQPSIASMIRDILSQYPARRDQPYDLLFISDASSLELLRKIERLGFH